MIKNDMSITEFSAVIENFIKYYNSFEQKLIEKRELEQALPAISNQTVRTVIEREINNIKAEDDTLAERHQMLAQQAVQYVFHNNYRKGLITIETQLDTDKDFGDTYNYRFSGKLGKPLYNIMTLCSWFAFWDYGHVIPKEKELNNHMTYNQFATVVNEHYIDEGSALTV